MKRLKSCLWSLATLAACSGYAFVWFRHNLDDAGTLTAAVIAGVIALASLVYSVVSPSAHQHVTKIILGCSALVATILAGLFLYYTWTERVRLQDLAIFPFLALICAVSLGAALAAWVAFWSYKWSGNEEPPDEESSD